MPRFFVEPSAVSEDRIVLTGDNAHHAAYSLRLAPGERIKVCDQKTAYLCEMVSFDSETATARILSASPVDTEPPFTAHLYQALPKGDKLDTVIQKAVECGVTSVTPFESSRCIVRAKPEAEARKTERRNRIAEEAAKQCGRGIIPDVSEPLSFADMISEAAKADLAIFCYEKEGERMLGTTLGSLRSNQPKTVAIVVGPEGGFSPEEAEKAEKADLLLLGLGKRILRTESAAAFVLACLSSEFELR